MNSEQTVETNVIDIPKYKSTLRLTESVSISFTYPKPNWWWRFWQRVFFGFVWEDYKE